MSYVCLLHVYNMCVWLSVWFVCVCVFVCVYTMCVSVACRLCFRAQAKGETERERLLLAYQVNEEVQHGHFPVSKELALEVAALLAQVEQGDLERPGPAAAPGSTPPAQTKTQQALGQALERFYPKHYKQDLSVEQLRWVWNTPLILL